MEMVENVHMVALTVWVDASMWHLFFTYFDGLTKDNSDHANYGNRVKLLVHEINACI